MTVNDDARIAIVLKKLGEAQNRLYEATRIYEHMLEDRATPIDVGSKKYIVASDECVE